MCAENMTEGVLNLGTASLPLPDLDGSRDVDLQFLALKSGILQLPDIVLSDKSQMLTLDTLSVSVKVL